MSEETTKPESVADAIHPRDAACDEAGRELIAFLNEWKRKYNLTVPEYLWLLFLPATTYIRQLGIVEREAQNRGVK